MSDEDHVLAERLLIALALLNLAVLLGEALYTIVGALFRQ